MAMPPELLEQAQSLGRDMPEKQQLVLPPAWYRADQGENEF
jgi:hypothetical protein